MKGDPVKPDALIPGECFVCRKTEDMDKKAFLHKECADALWDEKQRRREEAKQKEVKN